MSPVTLIPTPSWGTQPFEVLAYAVHFPGCTVAQVAYQMCVSQSVVRRYAAQLRTARYLMGADRTGELYPTATGRALHAREVKGRDLYVA